VIARAVLRLAAIAFAAAGMVDPAITRDLAVEQPLTVVAIDEQSLTTARNFQQRVRGAYATVVRRYEAATRAAACPADGGCVLVSDGALPERLTAGATVIGALRVPVNDQSVIAAIDLSSRVHLNASSILRVQLQRDANRVDVFDEGVLVGSASPAQSGSVEVSWMPLAVGPRKLRVVAGEDAADVGVRVDEERSAVLFYEPETSWAGTFVRRALLEDGRFDLRARAELASSIAITRGGRAQLDGSSVADVDVIVATSPHLLTRAQVDLLERFVTRRGGSVVLLPDQRPDGPIMRLWPRVVQQYREKEPQSIRPLRAAALLSFDEGPGISVLQRSRQGAVIVSSAIGRGRVIVSGALDAWRYRDASRGFEAYWTALMWEAAMAAGRPLRVTTRALAGRGEEVPIAVETRAMHDLPADISAEGTFTCERERGVLRLWPDGGPGSFKAVLRHSAAGRCRIAVSVAGTAAMTELLVADDVRSIRLDHSRLETAIAAHGGIVTDVAHEDELLSRIHDRLPPRREATMTWPMRSPLWIVPFVACLVCEWWLRRRGSLR
jgi:hypothetical protein